MNRLRLRYETLNGFQRQYIKACAWVFAGVLVCIVIPPAGAALAWLLPRAGLAAFALVFVGCMLGMVVELLPRWWPVVWLDSRWPRLVAALRWLVTTPEKSA